MSMNGTPHVGYLVQQFPPEVGAGPARVSELALRWQRHGARVTVITGMPNRPEGRIHAPYRGKLFMSEEWHGVRVLRSWLYASPRHGFTRTLANNLTFMATGMAHAATQTGKLDVLIASSPPFFVHVAGMAVRPFRRVPIVLEVRDLWPDYLIGMGAVRGPAARALLALERRMLGAAAHVVAVTESFRQRVIEKGVPPERVTLIPNGVDPRLYFREVPGGHDLAWRASPEEFVVGYLGNFGAGQDLTSVLQAADLLRAEPGLRFVLVGDGTDRERVLGRAAELRLSNVSIHPPIPKEQTRGFYNSCDACLVPLANIDALQEAIPSKIFEAMACERPVLASVAGEAAAVVERSGAGVVVPPGCAVGIAAAVRRLRSMTVEARDDMGARGRAYVVEHHARDRMAERYLDVLRDAARRSSSAKGVNRG
jgi:colanic acid biosynthesis glycosyl transferase WcaI